MTEISDSTRKIQEKILSDAKDEAQRIKSQAENQAEELIDKSKSEAEEMKKTSMAELEQRMTETKRQTLAEKKVDLNRALQNTKTELIERVFEKAEDKLREYVKSDPYKKTLEALIVDAGKALGGGDLLIKVNEKDRKKLTNKDLDRIAKKIQTETNQGTKAKLSDEALDSIGGTVVTLSDERAIVDDTFESRLERMREKTEAEVETILFE